MLSKNPSGTLNVTISKFVYFAIAIAISNLFTIVEGRKLKGQDMIGKNDPYV